MNTNQQDVFSLWKIFSEAGFLVNFFSYIIFVIAFFAVYLFFEKYFLLKRQSKPSNTLLNNLNDFIHEGRIDAALDYCDREVFPQSRVIKVGIERIGRPIQEISNMMKYQENFELNHFRKNVSIISFFSKLALLIGFLGTLVKLFFSFYDASLISEKFVNVFLHQQFVYALLPIIIGFFVAIFLYILHYLLVKKLDKLKLKLVKSQAEFINILNKP